jgi:hypothetical protein
MHPYYFKIDIYEVAEKVVNLYYGGNSFRAIKYLFETTQIGLQVR